MSRIHEALKKAEQDRAAEAPPPQPAVKPVVGSVAPPGASPAARPPDPVPARAPADQLTVEVLLAKCPKAQWTPDAKTALFSQPNGTLGAEAFRTLRSRLYQARSARSVRSLLVTSGLPEEGKTFICANLSQCIAQQPERRVLLIDADLRKSALHRKLGARPAPGLLEYLRGEADEFSIMQRGPLDNLFFVAAGEPISNPAEFINNGRLKSFLQRFSPLFDWVILDSPPAEAVSDAGLLAGICDAILLVVAAGRTPYDVAQRTRQLFRDKRLVGVVLNLAQRLPAYAAYYYYGYGKQPDGTKAKG